MLGVMRNHKKIQKSQGATKHTEKFWLLRQGNTEEKTHRDNAPASSVIGHRHTVALNSGGTMKTCKKHQTFEAIDKKLDEDSHRWTKPYR